VHVLSEHLLLLLFRILFIFLVLLQGLKEEPPLNTKCKDRFLIQSTIITPDKDTWAPSDVVGKIIIIYVSLCSCSLFF